MKRIINYLNLFVLGITCMYLTGCDDSQEESSEALSVVVFSPTRAVPGETITIVGTGLDKVNAVAFTDNDKVTDIEVTNANQIKVKAPSNLSEASYTLTLEADGQSVTANDELTVIMPEITAYTPSDVNAGVEMELSGSGLDHIAAVTFPGNLTVQAIDFLRKADNVLQLTVPEDIPTCSSVLTFTTTGGGTFESAQMNFIEKPAGEYVETEETVWDYTTDNGGTHLELTWGGGLDGASAGWFSGIELGDKITLYFDKKDGATDGYMLKLYYGDWSSILELNDESGNGDPNAAIDVSNMDSYSFTMFAGLLPWFKGTNGDTAMIVTGNNIYLTKITWTHNVWVPDEP